MRVRVPSVPRPPLVIASASGRTRTTDMAEAVVRLKVVPSAALPSCNSGGSPRAIYVVICRLAGHTYGHLEHKMLPKTSFLQGVLLFWPAGAQDRAQDTPSLCSNAAICRDFKRAREDSNL